jgi:hypothetical protein
MREQMVEYQHLPAGSILPAVRPAPRRVIVLIEQGVTEDWRDEVSDWIVRSGCLYMMAWGQDCSSWDDSVDYATLRKFDFSEVPDDEFVMTTWHSDDTLDDVFEYDLLCAFHPTIELPLVSILHIASSANRDNILERYEAVKEGLEKEASSEGGKLSLLDRLLGR